MRLRARARARGGSSRAAWLASGLDPARDPTHRLDPSRKGAISRPELRAGRARLLDGPLLEDAWSRSPPRRTRSLAREVTSIEEVSEFRGFLRSVPGELAKLRGPMDKARPHVRAFCAFQCAPSFRELGGAIVAERCPFVEGRRDLAWARPMLDRHRQSVGGVVWIRPRFSGATFSARGGGGHCGCALAGPREIHPCRSWRRPADRMVEVEMGDDAYEAV